jgi:precorrin-2/cobalt-factor-2 C20-methyltransferase
MSGRLTGVGVGPGDPDLITVKGVKALLAADQVFVPVGDGPSASASPAPAPERGYAERVVLAHVPADRVRRVVFKLGARPEPDPTQRSGRRGPGGPRGLAMRGEAARRDAWAAAGAAVAGVVGSGRHAAFATIGDPNLYSTFAHLADAVRALVPDVTVATVPGITAMQDLAARSGTVLAEADQTVALLPFTAGPGRLRAALADHDTVVVYKGGRLLPEVRAVLAEAGRLGDAVFGARLGLPGERVGHLPESAAPYLSAVLVTRPRGEEGTP